MKDSCDREELFILGCILSLAQEIFVKFCSFACTNLWWLICMCDMFCFSEEGGLIQLMFESLHLLKSYMSDYINNLCDSIVVFRLCGFYCYSQVIASHSLSFSGLWSTSMVEGNKINLTCFGKRMPCLWVFMDSSQLGSLLFEVI